MSIYHVSLPLTDTAGLILTSLSTRMILILSLVQVSHLHARREQESVRGCPSEEPCRAAKHCGYPVDIGLLAAGQIGDIL